MLKIIEKTKIWFAISLIIIFAGVFKIATSGLELSIDFAGGTIVQINMNTDLDKVDKTEIDAIIHKYAPGAETNKAKSAVEASAVMNELEIKAKDLSAENLNSMLNDLKGKYGKDVQLISQDHQGSSMGKETRNNAILAVILATLAMLIYVGFRFEFRFGISAIIALVHDVLTTLSIYALFRIPIDTAFVAAMLTVIGYSINDTIVVFDRIRENQKYMRKSSATELANASITQTMARSINTVLTTLITLVAVYIFVPSIRNFSLPLIAGIVSGCYSSIFIASPLWVIFKNKKKTIAKA